MAGPSIPGKPANRRSRNGCHNCKAHKIKCDEIKPICSTCQRTSTPCDYSLKLSWGGRTLKSTTHTENGFCGNSNNIPNRGINDNLQSNGAASGSTSGFISYQSKSKPVSKSSKPLNQTSIQGLDPISITSPVPFMSPSSLSNKSVLRKIKDIDLVFQPAPSQCPVKSEGFIQEYNIMQTLPVNNIAKKRSINQSLSQNEGSKRIKRASNPEFIYQQNSPVQVEHLDALNQFTEENWLSKRADYIPNDDFDHKCSMSNMMDGVNNILPINPSFTNLFSDPHITLTPESSTHHKGTSDVADYNLAQNNNFKPRDTDSKEPNGGNGFHHKNNSGIDLNTPEKSDLLSFLMGCDTPIYNSAITEDPFAKDFDIINETYPLENNHQNQLYHLPLKYQSPQSPSELFSYDFQSEYSGSDGGDLYPLLENYENRVSIRPTNRISIPRQLEPLPDILLQVPLYRELFYHFVHSLAQILVPVPNLYPNNPFKILLPRMALNTPHLLCLLVAFSASYRSKMLSQPEPREVVQQLLSRTYDGLAKSFDEPGEAYSDATLCTVILLSSFEILSPKTDEVWKTHLQGAKDIVLARKKLTPNYIEKYFTEITSTESKIEVLEDQIWLQPTISSANSTSLALSHNGGQKFFNPTSPKLEKIRPMAKSEDEVSYFLLRWFAYLDVLSALCSYKSSTTSLTTTSDPYNVSKIWSAGSLTLEQYKKRLAYKKHRLHQIGDCMNNSPDYIDDILRLNNELPLGQDIDALLGFDINMVPIFSRIGEMAHERRNLPLGHEPSLEFFNQANELRDILLECYSARRDTINVQGEDLHLDIFTDLEKTFPALAPPSSTYLPFDGNSNNNDNDGLHSHPNEGPKFYWRQLVATNGAFCYAGLVHLYRRVYCLKREDPLVQDAVKNITSFLINSIPDTDSTSACVSFPLLTASFEIMDKETRKWYEQRLYNHSISGYCRTERIVQIVKTVWEEDGARPWWEIAEEHQWEIFMG